MPFKNLAPIEAPTNPDLQNEIEKTLNLKSEIFELFDIDLDQYDFGDEHTNESLKPISKEFNDNCIRLDSTHQNFDENLNKMYSEIAILEQLFQTWEEFESKAKKLPSLKRTISTPFHLMNIDAVCEFVGDNNCLLTCFLDATNKEDFIILNLQLEPLEWDYHSATFDVPEEIKNILTLEKKNSLFFLNVINYYCNLNRNGANS